MADSWSSVQVATLVVDALTPIAVAGLGIFLARASRRLEQVQWANQTVVTRRLEIFADIAPDLNKLLCFATFVGGWKELEPATVIAIKRRVDETMYANRVLFSPPLFDAYRHFMATLFATRETVPMSHAFSGAIKMTGSEFTRTNSPAAIQSRRVIKRKTNIST